MEPIEMNEYGEVIGEGTVRFERLLPGPIERVWVYLTESDKRAQWLAAGEMPSRVGGAFTLHFRHSELSLETPPVPAHGEELAGGDIVRGTVTRWEPPHALAITWDEATGRDSEVTLALRAEGDAVRLELTHHRLDDRALMLDVASGWHTHLGILAARLEGREPPAFWPVHEALRTLYEARLP